MEDYLGQGSDSSDEEKKRSPRGKRSRINSIKSEKIKEKMQSSTSYNHRLELEVV
jgi:hypothetical protein